MSKPSQLFFLLGIFLFLVCAVNAQTPKELTKQLIKDDTNVREIAKNTAASIEEISDKLEVKKIDLNGDKISEYIVSGFICGQNCSYWLYKKEGTRYIQIPFNGSFTSLKPLKTKNKGYNDLIARMFLNCCEGAIYTFRFNGFRYVSNTCSMEYYGYTDKKGVYHEYKAPKIKKGCN